MSASNAKFWHPVPFWQVLLLFLVGQIAAHLLVVGLREGAGIAIPFGGPIAGGLGALLGLAMVQAVARKRRGGGTA